MTKVEIDSIKVGDTLALLHNSNTFFVIATNQKVKVNGEKLFDESCIHINIISNGRVLNITHITYYSLMNNSWYIFKRAEEEETIII